ncbi:biotin--[acetyl-CoA-carboxylase] ligase (plasmid) [Limosilactobacillus reuteri]|uniref:Biotin--[acetyl-CoA-carboxylase] ligase n=1 Tax=Limosilactobacillus reuteri TaxID=1598 RepID=A0A3M6SI62_LIMRT|nr:biotin--[acetyl-CoA-carboxylase] ligase [Limosilactobacillus reuteri]RMX27010.1 biotin--[acetyl-CoA-carboxylase] ligase [Limosilactobacillus reuteri]
MIEIIELSSVSSTMDTAFNMIESASQNSDFAIFSHKQSNGHGKFNRKFYSPLDQGIYMTIAIKESSLPYKLNYFLIPIIAAVSVQKNIQKFSKDKIEFKWVNDLYILDKKIGGILCEYKEINNNNYMIVGIGINITKKFNYKYPKDSSNKIGYIVNSNFNLKKSIYDIISTFYTALYSPSISKIYIENYISNQILKRGMFITLRVGSSLISGQFVKITTQGQLIIKVKDRMMNFSYGEVKKILFNRISTL